MWNLTWIIFFTVLLKTKVILFSIGCMVKRGIHKKVK